jgi:hypothetical protein
MRNKNTRVLFLPLIVVAILCMGLFACKKNQSVYYDYQNTIKEYDGNALQYLQSQKGAYDSLLVVLNLLPALKDSISNQKITFFAVTNPSFAVAIKNLNVQRKDQSKAPLYLKNLDLAQLDTLMCRYILKGIRVTDDYKPFADGILISSIKYNYGMHVQYKKLNASGFVEGGPQSIIYSDPKKSIFQKYWENTTTDAVNIKTKNATINILAASHDFGFNEFVKRVNK